MPSRLDQWIEENRPREPRVGVGTSEAEYAREWERYRVESAEYANKLREVVRRHGPELDAAVNERLDDLRQMRRTFGIHEPKGK